MSADKNIPLAVDLDGSLIKTELPFESFLFVLTHKPVSLLKIFLEKIKNRKPGFVKQKLESLSDFSLQNIPWSKKLLDFLKEEKSKGRKLVLCTGSTQAYAEKINKIQNNLFDEVYGSTLGQNLAGKKKGIFLSDKYGEKQFDYAGNSLVDLQTAPYARKFILVNPSFPATVFFKTVKVSRILLDKKTNPSAVAHVLGFPLWFLNCSLFAFLLMPSALGSSFFRVIFTIVVLNFLASACSVLFFMTRIFFVRKQYSRKNSDSSASMELYNNLFAIGDLSLPFGFLLFALFFILFIVSLFHLSVTVPLTWITSCLYAFSVYLLIYKKIFGKTVSHFFAYSVLFVVLFMQGVFLTFV